jgi:uncharacterized protein (TIGR00369 family)
MKLLADMDDIRQPDDLQFELEEWIDTAPFETLLGLKIDHAAGGEALLTMPFTVKLANGGGVMHGGAMASLADTAVAMAIKSLLPHGTTFATTGLTMEFLAPVVSGVVHARAHVQESEGRTFQGVCELLGEDRQLYARFTSIFKVARQQ